MPESSLFLCVCVCVSADHPGARQMEQWQHQGLAGGEHESFPSDFGEGLSMSRTRTEEEDEATTAAAAAAAAEEAEEQAQAEAAAYVEDDPTVLAVVRGRGERLHQCGGRTILYRGACKIACCLVLVVLLSLRCLGG